MLTEREIQAKIKLDLNESARWDWLTVTQILEHSGLDGTRPAIVFEGAQRTYSELRERSRRVANALIGLGVEPMDRVAIVSTNRLEYIEIEAGIALARAIMVALNWRLAEGEFANLIRRSRASVLLVEDRFLELFQRLRAAGEIPDVRTIVLLGRGSADWDYEEWIAQTSVERPSGREGSFEDPHEIIYTSGTTGDPKGVVWTNGMMLFNTLQYVIEFRLGAENSHYTLVDQYYIGGRHAFVWPLLLQGGTAHVRSSGGFDASKVVHYWAEHRITHQMVAPAMLYEILRVRELDHLDLSALSLLVCAGAPLEASALEETQRRLPHTEVVQVFGMSEAGGCVTAVPGVDAKRKAGSAGRPVWSSQIRIEDDAGNALPAREIGEIVLRSPAVTAGYWDQPELTREAIVDGWLHTGDLGYLDDEQFMFIVGRKKDMIISGGMNIYPSEIEEVLREHPTVLDVAVIGVPHKRWGETVCAVIELAEGAQLDEPALIEFCRSRLASYKKPTVIHAVDAIPRTSIGKPKKFLLREMFQGAGTVGSRAGANRSPGVVQEADASTQ
jgi:fatty-acyl-CoA synthase